MECMDGMDEIGLGVGGGGEGVRQGSPLVYPAMPRIKRTEGSLLPLPGGFRHLKSFQIAQLAFDVTVRF